MSKVTDIKREAFVYRPNDGGGFAKYLAVYETPEGCILISQPSHQVLLTREQAEFVLPHLQRWLEDD